MVKDIEVPSEVSSLLADARMFEFRADDKRGTIREGRFHSTYAAFGRELVDVNSVARMHVKRVRRNNAIVREGFTLLSLDRVLPKPTKSHKVPLWQIIMGN